MDILTYVVVFVVLEVGICAICCLVCRERSVTTELRKQPKKMSHHPAHEPSRITQSAHHQTAWSHASDQEPNGKDNNVHLTCFPPHILP